MKGGNRVAYGLSCGPIPIQVGFKDIVGWLGVHTPTRGDTVWIVRGRRVSVISGKVMVRGTGAGHKAVWLPLDIGVTRLLAWWRRHWRQSPRHRLPCVGALLSGLELSWLRGTVLNLGFLSSAGLWQGRSAYLMLHANLPVPLALGCRRSLYMSCFGAPL